MILGLAFSALYFWQVLGRHRLGARAYQSGWRSLCRLCRLLMLMQCQSFRCVLCSWNLEAMAGFGLLIWGQHAGVPLLEAQKTARLRQH